MKTGELRLNGKDAFATYGLFMTAAGLSALRAPRTPKEPIAGECRLEHGRRVIMPVDVDGTGQLFGSREFGMEVCMSSRTAAEHEVRRDRLERDLAAGWVEVTTVHSPGTVYRCRYAGTSSYTEYGGRAARFVLKFEEPNPADRS